MLSHFKVADLANLARGPRNPKNVDRIVKKLKEFLGYDFLISDPDPNRFSHEEDVRESFGQVETPRWVADLMARLAIKNGNEKILDPCFGNGVFLRAAYERMSSLSGDIASEKLNLIYGVEIDPLSFTRGLSEFLKDARAKEVAPNFFLGDIFDFTKRQFDVVIMNPPYVRQEKLSESGVAGSDKEIMIKKALDGPHSLEISARSNLYSYFIIHLTKHVKENGRLAAIIPKVWLDSKYGQSLQKFLLENYDVEYVLDFGTDTFSGVIVEDCILILKKGATPDAKTKFVHIKRKDDLGKIERLLDKKTNVFENEIVSEIVVDRKMLLADHKWGKLLHAPPEVAGLLLCKGLVRLGDIANVVRGTTTLWNDFFMFDDEKARKHGIGNSFLVDILSSPKDVVGYATGRWATPSKMLSVEKMRKSGEPSSLSKYIESASRLDAPLSVKRMMENDPAGWHMHSRPKSGPIVFSYIIRRVKNFVLNDGGYAIRDNFYIITPKKDDPLLLFGLLNSSLVRTLLELSGRRYGNGLLKIQAYELADLGVPDPSILTDSQKSDIMKVAGQISKMRFDDPKVGPLLREIDMTVHSCLKISASPEDMSRMEHDLREKRLGRTAA